MHEVCSGREKFFYRRGRTRILADSARKGNGNYV